jgi:uncharacterized protein with PIN domain/sulfur carrier protein ThiS
MPTIAVRFYAELGDFLPPERRGRGFEHICAPGDTVKDIIEGLGVPHTEVDLILVNGISVGFDHKISAGDRVSIYPVFEALDISSVSSVRTEPLRVPKFAADVHLGKLARFLRIAGFDTAYRNCWADAELVEAAVAERRAILTCDRRLLMRSAVTHGYLVREREPRAQLAEVLEHFDLWSAVKAFSRCPVCNQMVEPAAKAEVVAALPQGTAAGYDEFWRCTGCGQVYWRGAHYLSLRELLERG